jgi:hypothetical protein
MAVTASFRVRAVLCVLILLVHELWVAPAALVAGIPGPGAVDYARVSSVRTASSLQQLIDTATVPEADPGTRLTKTVEEDATSNGIGGSEEPCMSGGTPSRLTAKFKGAAARLCVKTKVFHMIK